MGPVSAEIEIDAPRELLFATIADLARRPSFTDHFLSGFHLTRIESSGVGAGARFRVASPLRSVWMDTAIVELEEPYRIVERGRGGRGNRIPATTIWELTEGAGSLAKARVSHWTEPPNPLDRALEVLAGNSIWEQRGWREALRRLRDQLESGETAPAPVVVAGGNPHATGIPSGGLYRLSPPMARHRRSTLSLLAVLLLAVTALALSACGYSSDSKDVVEGEPVKLGELQYNVVFSRFLNPNDNEDSAYLIGQPQTPPGHSYFGVFVEVQNESEEPQTLASSFTITDAGHQTFEAIPSESLYALPFGGEVESQEQIPILDSTPQEGPIEGSLVLFELPASASENRPLTLSIPGPEGPAAVTLDL